MKKQYRIITLVINLLLLVLFVVVEGVYTYETATMIMNEKWESAKNHAENSITKKNITPDMDVIYEIHSDVGRKAGNALDDIGYYEFYLCDDGKKIESCNQLVISYTKYETNDIETKYIPVDYDFKWYGEPVCEHVEYEHVEIDAMCDEHFIFNGTINDGEHVYAIGENELASDENAVHVTEWLKKIEGSDSMDWINHTSSTNLKASYYTVAKTEYEKKMCEKAKKKLEEILAKTEIDSPFMEYNDHYAHHYINYPAIHIYDNKGNVVNSIYVDESSNDKMVIHSQKKLGTSLYISYAYHCLETGNAYCIYLFHPLEITFRNNIKKYITSLIVFILLEIFVVIVMRKLYSNRMKYELMRQDLTRSIAHDLKTPLAITKAYTENWEYIDEKDRHRYAERLHSEIDNMASIINNMINVSKFDSEEQLNMEKIELSSMISEILERMKPIISERDLDVRFFTDRDDGKYFVLADPKMMRIAINNFITNAVKYAESWIYIDLYSNKKKIKFVIGNDGKTISKKDIRKIWEPFYKGDKARTDRIGSSGMGLALNRNILKLHKAKHKCTSKNGRTTFWFEIKRMDKNGK